jgi:hypothetical protein
MVKSMILKYLGPKNKYKFLFQNEKVYGRR